MEVVVADSLEQARDAAARIKVDHREEQPVASWEAGLPHAFPPVAVDGQKPTVAILADGVSSIDDVIVGADVVIDVTYTEPIYHHNPMEPHATTAVLGGGRPNKYHGAPFVPGQQRKVAADVVAEAGNIRAIC